MPFSWQRRSNICVAYLAVGPSAYRGGKVNWIPLSVRIVWILYGTAAIRASRNAAAEVLPVFLTSCTEALRGIAARRAGGANSPTSGCAAAVSSALSENRTRCPTHRGVSQGFASGE